MPVVWIIDAYRAGERAQVRALADALGWTVKTVHLEYRRFAFASKLFRRSDLSGIDLEKSDALVAPWPDLVISCGMANEPVCRWVREQSGGRTRIIHIGRPWSLPQQMDLVITTPQYRIPDHENVLVNDLTLNAVSSARLEEERERWSGHFQVLPEPRVAVVLGGNSGPYTFGPLSAGRLARLACDRARQLGGSLMVSSSSRTSPEALAAFEAELDVPCQVYRWRSGDSANPYFGMLALASETIVTADSIAMLSEAVATAVPVWMFDLGGMREGETPAIDFRWGALLYRALMRGGWKRLSRDIDLVHQRLIAGGQARWLGDDAPLQPRRDNRDMDRALERARALVEPAIT